MKNLKKLLSVVLAIVLAFCLVVPASAANVSDYPDADDVTYTEAVDLFTALGFLQGRDTGKFDPQGLVTREEAAKIITYMLIGSSRADALTTTVSDFSDVALGRWSAPFIQYCATQGIINGMGDGTFNPTGNVTGAQFAKMLLCSIGYGVKDEYTGSNWAMKTIADATSLGILSLNVDYSAGATREEVSQYGFNAYTLCNTVVWNSTNQAYQQATDIDGKSAKGTLATQQGVKNDVSEYTTNGVKYYRWTKMGAELTGGYTKEKVIGSSTDGTALSKLTDSSNSKYIASLDESPVYFYNGTAQSALAYQTNSTNIATATKVGQTYLYNGVVYKVTTPDSIGASIANVVAHSVDVTALRGVIVTLINADFDSKAETVKIVQKTVDVITGDPRYVSSSDTVTIPALGIVNEAASKVPGYDTLKDKDVVLWYKDNAGTYHIDLATSVTGTVNKFVSSTSVTVDNTLYKYTGLLASTALTDLYGKIESSAGLADTTVYLDDGGYVCYTTQANVSNPAANYLFVTDISSTNLDNRIRVIFSDGTSSIVFYNETGDKPVKNQFFSYSVTNDIYKLKEVPKDPNGPGNETNDSKMQESRGNYVEASASTNTNTIKQGHVDFLTINGTTSKVLADGKTRFVYTDASSGLHYGFVGIANAPDFTADDSAALINEDIFVLFANRKAVFVYATGGDFTPSTTSGDWVYIMNNDKSVNYVSSSLRTYTYKALVNGSETTITTTQGSDQFAAGVGLYRVTAYDKDGYVTIATPAGEASKTNTAIPAVSLVGYHTGEMLSTNGDSVSVSGGTITVNYAAASIPFGTTPYYGVLNANAKIYCIDPNVPSTYAYEMTASEVNAISNFSGYTVDCTKTSNSDSTISAVYLYMPKTTPLNKAPAVQVNDTNSAGLTVQSFVSTQNSSLAVYTVKITGTEIAGTEPSTIMLANGTWAATIPSFGGVARTNDTTLTIDNGTTMPAGGYEVTFNVALPATTSPIVTVNDDASVKSSAITFVNTNTTLTITLVNGTFKSTIAASDFIFTGTDSTTLANGTFSRASDTEVTITFSAGLTGSDNFVVVPGSTQATQATSVTAVAS